MAKPRALIFGVSGQDGSYLSRFLLAKGYEVHGTSRDSAAGSFGNLRRLGLWGRVKLHSAVLTDFRSVFQVMRAVRPREVYNLAGQNSVGLSFSQPVETFEGITVGNLNILECLRMARSKARVYNACSGECFGDTEGHRADESMAFRPRSPYAVAKAAAFWTAANYREAYGLFICSGIMFNHESPLRPERYVTRKISAAAARIAGGAREKLRLGDLSVRRDWGWAPDYVEAMWRMLRQPRPGDYVVATGKTCSLGEFVAAVFGHFRLDWRRHVVVDRRLFRPTEVRGNAGDASKAARVLSWRPKTAMPQVAKLMAEAEEAALPGRV
jgi:GDPmannose 4,6-dehydratase